MIIIKKIPFVRYKDLTTIAEIFAINSENKISSENKIYYKNLFINFIKFYEIEQFYRIAKKYDFFSYSVNKIIAEMSDSEADKADDFLYDYENYRKIKRLLKFIQDDGYDISDFYMHAHDIDRITRYAFVSKKPDENGLYKQFDVVFKLIVRPDGSIKIKPVAMYIDNSQRTDQNPCNYFVARNIEEAVQKYSSNTEFIVTSTRIY